MPASKSWIEAQDELLAGLIDEAGITSVDDGTACPSDDRIRLWQGDITTGVFGFPRHEAARIAVKTVQEWLSRTGAQMTVVFNVFSNTDYDIYADLLLCGKRF